VNLPKLPRIDPAQAGIVGVATAAAVLSFSSLRALAISTNTWSWIAWLLPISLDAAAATATFVWLRTDRREIVRLAATIAWSTIVLSVVGNGVHHAFQALGIVPWWWVALIVGAVPPAVFGAVVHLAITAAKPVVADNQPAKQAEPAVPEPTLEPVVEVVDEPVEDDHIDWSLSERRLAAELGITRHAARQLKAARTEVAS
jgi:hypothetical protein